MVHTFTSLGVRVAVDVNSGAVHVLDKPAYDLLSLLDGPLGASCPDDVAEKLPYDRIVIDHTDEVSRAELLSRLEKLGYEPLEEENLQNRTK